MLAMVIWINLPFKDPSASDTLPYVPQHKSNSIN